MRISKSIVTTLLYIIVSLLTEFWIFLVYFYDNDLSKIFINKSHFISSILLLVAVFVFLKKVDSTIFISPFRTQNKYYFFGGILGILFIFIQFILLTFFYFLFKIDEPLTYSFDPSRLLHWVSFATVLMVPVIEEFFFRGYIQGNLQKNYKPFVAILITSILFSSIHLPFDIIYFQYLDIPLLAAGRFSQSFHTFFGGLILGYLFYKSKSVGPPIIMHITWNFLAILF